MSRLGFAAVMPVGLCLGLAVGACNDAPQVDQSPSSQTPDVVPSLPTIVPSVPSALGSGAVPVPSGGAPPKDVVKGMVEVPAGRFTMGCARGDAEECNFSYEFRHEVWLDTYFIDRTEVTVDDYRTCHEAGGCSADRLNSQAKLEGETVSCNWGRVKKGRHPINCIDWAEAVAYCAWAGKRLPSEAEWEKAARGTDGRTYPWGNDWLLDDPIVHIDFAQIHREGSGTNGSTYPVGSRPAGKSPYGALDMLGSVFEWTADWFDRTAYAAPARRNPGGPPTGTTRVVRGRYHKIRITERLHLLPTIRFGLLGFRCARSAPPETGPSTLP